MIVQWWGHATTTITIGGRRVLTDPVLAARVAHLSRRAGAVPAAEARVAELVLVSHLHPDHLHLPSLRLLPATTRLIGPRGARGLIARGAPALLDRLTEVEPGVQFDADGLRVRAVAAHHDGRRLPGSRFHGPALGFVLDDDVQTVWFAGDTGLFAEISSIGPVDVAVVPVGGWGPSLGPHHLDPQQAVEAAVRVGARDAVPVHYGTFWPTGLHLGRARFDHLFVSPGQRFVDAANDRPDGPTPHRLDHHGSVEISPAAPAPASPPGGTP